MVRFDLKNWTCIGAMQGLVGRASSRAGSSNLRSSPEQYGSARNTATEDGSVASPHQIDPLPVHWKSCMMASERLKWPAL